MAQAGPDNMLREAAALHQAGDLARAEALYRAVLRARPEDPNALHLLGVALRQRGRLDEALPLLDRAVAIRPDNALFRANRGAALADAGRLA
ncbi:MAG TPA: tetratricopeptide repeat protein, partial [Acetobacteraceae bacterium]|nr:tetratricopeptide repeat protein [Acetobacteraceae bacterium]